MINQKKFFSTIIKQLETACNAGDLEKIKQLISILKLIIKEDDNSVKERNNRRRTIVRPVKDVLSLVQMKKMDALFKPIDISFKEVVMDQNDTINSSMFVNKKNAKKYNKKKEMLKGEIYGKLK